MAGAATHPQDAIPAAPNATPSTNPLRVISISFPFRVFRHAVAASLRRLLALALNLRNGGGNHKPIQAASFPKQGHQFGLDTCDLEKGRLELFAGLPCLDFFDKLLLVRNACLGIYFRKGELHRIARITEAAAYCLPAEAVDCVNKYGALALV